MRLACEPYKRTPRARFWGRPNAQYLYVRTSRGRRLQVRFTLDQRAAIAARAESSGLSQGAIVRQLVAAALKSDAGVEAADSPLGIAALVAAEHAVLMVASVLPDGERRMHELGPKAAAAAEERLVLVRGGDR